MKATMIAVLVCLGVGYVPLTSAANSSLRTLGPASGIQIGAAVSADPLRNEAPYGETLAREFSLVTPENALKMGPLRPSRDQYNFSEADLIIDFAQSHGMQARGHTLIWHEMQPGWLTQGNFSADEVRNILRDHIFTVMGRYRGRIVAWDVVNEAFNEDGSLRDTFWLRTLGQEYIELAFRWAHEADPQAVLFYNDYNNETINPKSDAIYRLVQDLIARGVPIHGVGLQMHLRADIPPDPQSVAANMERIAQLGLQVQITELDVRIQNASGSTEERLNVQATVYDNMLSVCLEARNCTAFITWGVTDRYSWIPGFTGQPDAPLLFDTDYRPKPAYNSVASRLAGQQQPEPTNPAVRVEVSAANPSEQMQVVFRLFNVTDVYGLQAHCVVNPAVLVGVSHSDGEGFNSDNSFFIDQGFNAADGSWLIAASRLQPAPAISGNVLAYSLNYTVQSEGDRTVNCEMMVVGTDGNEVAVEVINAVPTVTPPPPTPIPPTPVPTAEITPTPLFLATISGTMQYQNGPDSAGIKVELLSDITLIAEAVTQADGNYRFADVPAGSYTLQASAPQHLSVVYSLSLTEGGELPPLSSVTLPGGDTDNNGVIDVLDATFIGANFDIETPPAPANADLNRDQIVNLRDLVLVGVNFGRQGPVALE
jgi:endo-1,4-beta-xylanase